MVNDCFMKRVYDIVESFCFIDTFWKIYENIINKVVTFPQKIEIYISESL